MAGNVAGNFEARATEQAFLLAAVVAALAAIFMIAVWAPMQMRAFSQATESAQPASYAGTAAATSELWIDTPFVTADGNITSLAALHGQVRVVTMMYTHCPGVCPLAVATLQQMEAHLTPAQRRQVRIVALSLDPERDSAGRLREFRDARGIDSSRWILARPSIEGARKLAGALGVSYRVLDSDSVDHQSVFVLLGKSGQVLARSSNTRNADPAFFTALQAAAGAN